MSKKRIIIGLAIIIGLFACLFACEKPDRQTVLRVGGIYALTGKGASFGKWVKNGVDLAVEEINQSWELNEKRLEVISEDTQSEPKHAVSAFEKLITIDKIPVAVGFITSSEALACAPVAERAQVVMITPIAGSPKIKEAGDFVFRTRESGLPQSYKVAEYIYNDLKIHEAAILCENAANAVGYRDAFIEKFKDLGGKIKTSLTYEEGQTDFRIVLTQLKNSQPKTVYMPGVGEVIGRVLKQANELGLKTRFFSSAGIEDPKLFELAGDAANGIIYGAPAFSLGSKDQATHSFVEKYRQKFGEDPSVYSANAYDAMMLLAEAIGNGKNKSQEIRDYLYQVKDFSGASGQLTFDEFGEVSKPIILKETKGQKFSAIGK